MQENRRSWQEFQDILHWGTKTCKKIQAVPTRAHSLEKIERGPFSLVRFCMLP